MLETLIIVLLILWLAGYGLGVAGNAVHLLLVVLLVLVLVRLLQGRPLP